MCEVAEADVLSLPLDAGSAGAARRFLSRALCEAHCQSVASDAVLLTSELVTNAAVHGGPPITLTVECMGDAIEVRVHDGSSRPPVPRQASDTDTGGRGLQLVDALSTSWGVEEIEGDGKETWFRLAVG